MSLVFSHLPLSLNRTLHSLSCLTFSLFFSFLIFSSSSLTTFSRACCLSLSLHTVYSDLCNSSSPSASLAYIWEEEVCMFLAEYEETDNKTDWNERRDAKKAMKRQWRGNEGNERGVVSLPPKEDQQRDQMLEKKEWDEFTLLNSVGNFIIMILQTRNETKHPC